MNTPAFALLVAIGMLLAITAKADASLVSWYFYANHDANALDSGETGLPAFGGALNVVNVGTSEVYTDAGKSITADGFRSGSSADILENFRGANDIGHGIYGGSVELGAGALEVMRYTLDTSLTDYTAYVSSVDGSEGVEWATSDSSDPTNGGLTWIEAGIHSGGDGNGGVVEDVNAISLDSLFGEGLKKYLFVREEVGGGGDNDDILIMQITAESVIPEPTTIVVWSLLGVVSMTVARRRR